MGDCCVICVCPYCALCQMKQHYDYYDGSDDEEEAISATPFSGQRVIHQSPLNAPQFHSKCRHNHHFQPANHKAVFASESRTSKPSPITQLGRFLEQSMGQRNGHSCCVNSRYLPPAPMCAHQHSCCTAMAHISSHGTQHPHPCTLPHQPCPNTVWLRDDAHDQRFLNDGTRVNMHRY